MSIIFGDAINAVRFASASLMILAMLVLCKPAAHAQSKILIDGSTGTAPLVAALGKAFAAKGGAAVEIGKGLGGRERLEALASGKIDIAMASHGLKIDEVTRRGMVVHRIAKSAVVFAVHESAKINRLTQAQVCAVYQGRHKNWKEIGGADLAIVAHVRPDSEVDTEVIRDHVGCLKAMKFPEAVKVMAKGGDMARALAETSGAFGVTSATVVEQSKGKVIAVALEGVAPSARNIAAGRYRLVRDAFLVTRKDADGAVKAFIAFVKSREGAAVIQVNGAIAATK
jgi:phosphate transport system substrate-binding protein